MRNMPTNHNRDEWDDASRTYRGFDRANELVEERPYTAEENADADRDANKATLTQQALAALSANLNDVATNDAALLVANPTNAQLVAQVKELTRQSTRGAKQRNALIRLLLDKLDATT